MDNVSYCIFIDMGGTAELGLRIEGVRRKAAYLWLLAVLAPESEDLDISDRP